MVPCNLTMILDKCARSTLLPTLVHISTPLITKYQQYPNKPRHCPYLPLAKIDIEFIYLFIDKGSKTISKIYLVNMDSLFQWGNTKFCLWLEEFPWHMKMQGALDRPLFLKKSWTLIHGVLTTSIGVSTQSSFLCLFFKNPFEIRVSECSLWRLLHKFIGALTPP